MDSREKFSLTCHSREQFRTGTCFPRKRSMGQRKTKENDQKKKKKKEIDHRPWSTPVNECVRERNRGGERRRRGRRRRRRRHSGLLLQALVRGRGRLGRLEGVPFQTLRIDLFVDGSSSLHPLLVVVDHVLKLFQRFSTGSLLSLFFSPPPPFFPVPGHDSLSWKSFVFTETPLQQSCTGETVSYTFDPLTIDISTPIIHFNPPPLPLAFSPPLRRKASNGGGKGKDRS